MGNFPFNFILLFFYRFSWSEAAHKTGLNVATTARIFNKLMTQRLKLKKYIAQGGDVSCQTYEDR